jgi:hypothetical protein
LTAFESSVQESRENVENPEEPLPLTVVVINKALKAVSHDVFPHRALSNQIRWMERHMRKPAGMGICAFVATVTQMNAKLIRFPGATTDDLFKAERLVELLVTEFQSSQSSHDLTVCPILCVAYPDANEWQTVLAS